MFRRLSRKRRAVIYVVCLFIVTSLTLVVCNPSHMTERLLLALPLGPRTQLGALEKIAEGAPAEEAIPILRSYELDERVVETVTLRHLGEERQVTITVGSAVRDMLAELER